MKRVLLCCLLCLACACNNPFDDPAPLPAPVDGSLPAAPPQYVKCQICGNVAELKTVGRFKGAQWKCTTGHTTSAHFNAKDGVWQFDSIGNKAAE